jgi:hypothetical protein
MLDAQIICIFTHLDAVPWRNISLESIPQEPQFYKQSPFSYFSLHICKQNNEALPSGMYNAIGDVIVEQTSDECEDEDQQNVQKNPHYNIQFLKYLIQHVFVFGAMMNHSLRYLNELSTEDDTYATSESWNSVTKS